MITLLFVKIAPLRCNLCTKQSRSDKSLHFILLVFTFILLFAQFCEETRSASIQSCTLQICGVPGPGAGSAVSASPAGQEVRVGTGRGQHTAAFLCV